MTDTQTVTHPKAEPGRRVEFIYYRDLKQADPPKYPGVITALIPEQGASVKVRLDGERNSLHLPPDYRGLTYCDEVGPVPDLPMGRFTPTADQFGGEYAGVPVCGLESEEIIALTADPDAAVAAVTAYCVDVDLDLAYMHLERLTAVWAVFEWQPEDADVPWIVSWGVPEGTDRAVRIHYLPA